MNPLIMGMFHEENTLLPVIRMSFAHVSERPTVKFVPRRSSEDLDLHLIGNNLKSYYCPLGSTRNSLSHVLCIISRTFYEKYHSEPVI